MTVLKCDYFFGGGEIVAVIKQERAEPCWVSPFPALAHPSLQRLELLKPSFLTVDAATRGSCVRSWQPFSSSRSFSRREAREEKLLLVAARSRPVVLPDADGVRLRGRTRQLIRLS